MDINGAEKHIHADKLRIYHIQINEVMCDTVTTDHEQTRVNQCAVIYDKDSDFESADVIDTEINILNFVENLIFVTVKQHELDVSTDCEPRRLKINYILQDLEPLVEARIQELLRLGSVHPQRVTGRTPNVCVWGGALEGE